MLVDYHIHVAAHGEYNYNRELITQFIDNAINKGIDEIGFSEHDEFIDLIDITAINTAQLKHNNVTIRLGLEIDFIPGREKYLNKIINLHKYDYIIGSIHFLDDWGFDHPDYKNKFAAYDIDQLYESYFNMVARMVNSNLFDIVGHFDLIKIWGHRPHKKNIKSLVEPVLKQIKESGMVVEINSAGLRKPVKELYPSEEIIKLMFNLGIPITLGSDAHQPDQVGENFDKIIDLIQRIGYKYIVKFNQHKKIMVPIK